MKDFILIIITCFLFPSCATIYTGTRDTIHFSSYPQGATVTHGKKVLGTTPLTYRVHRTFNKRPVQIKGEAGTKEIYLSRKFNLWTLPTILTIIGPAIDILSSSFFKYDKSFYEIDFNPGKERHYNVWENFFVITEKGDTFYIRPEKDGVFEGMGHKIKFTLLDGKTKTLSLDSVTSYKKSIYGATYEKVNLKPDKPNKKIFACLVLRNGEYSLYEVDYATGGGVDMNGNVVGGGTKQNYYVFKNNVLFSELDNKNEFINHREYFAFPDFKDKPENYKKDYTKSFRDLFD